MVKIQWKRERPKYYRLYIDGEERALVFGHATVPIYCVIAWGSGTRKRLMNFESTLADAKHMALRLVEEQDQARRAA